MSEWLPALYNWLPILGGIIITHSLFLTAQFHGDSEGYMWRAARKIWLFMLMFFTVEWLIGLLFFHLSRGIQEHVSVPTPLSAFIIGIMVAAIPSALETLILPKKGTTAEALAKPITRLLLKLKIILRHKFAWAIESCRQQDVFDCQKEDSWGLGISPQTTGRRLRMLYEFAKEDIAEKRKDVGFLRYDEGHTPWSKFYILVKHLGRSRVRYCIEHPVTSHCPDWDGRERRRREAGTRADRVNPEDRNNPRSRLYDDPALIKRIESGRRSKRIKNESASAPLLPADQDEGN